MNEELQKLGNYLTSNITTPNIEEQITLILEADSPI